MSRGGASGGRPHGGRASAEGDGPARPGAGADRPRHAAGEEPLGPETAAGLAPLRERIDAIDHEIVALLNERAHLALEIGRVKQVTGRRTVRDAAREAEVLERVTHASAGLFPEPELVALYRKLIAATRRVQHAQKRRAAPGDQPAGDEHEAEPVPGGGGPPDSR